MKVLVVADHNNKDLTKSTLNTVFAANEIGPTDLLIIGNECKTVADSAAKVSGLNKIYLNDDLSYKNFLSENISEFLKDFSTGYSHIIFTNNAFGKNVAPRLSALLDSMIVPDIIEILDPITFKRPIYAGNAIATCKSHSEINILTIRSTSFPEVEMSDNNVEIEVINKSSKNDKSKYIGADIEKTERPELTSADIVVSGGRGLGSGENFKILEKLADKLGAAMGASRAAVDAGFVPNDWQVGQTGKIVAPDLYIAVGISGAIQHIAGIKDSKYIVCINKDEEAPIFKFSDFGLVADLFEALPTLEKKL